MLAVHAQWPWFYPAIGVVFGAVMGSFLACMVQRLRAGETLRQPPSHCPHCQTVLRVPDLVPVFSWLVRRGQCAYCSTPIGVALLLAELAGAALGGGLVWVLLP